MSKSLVVVASVFVLLWPGPRGPADRAVQQMHTPVAVVMALAMLALTLFWTTVSAAEGASALAKHGKLLLVPLLVLLLRTRREATLALAWFAGAQMIQLLSSWLLLLGAPVPWATSDQARTDFTVFSNYLGQSIMMAVFAAVCWHLRLQLASGWRRWAACVVAALAIGNTLFVLQGRTGHVIAIVLLSLAIAWELPRRWRYTALLAPFIVAGVLFAGSETIRERAHLVVTETASYLHKDNKVSSSGERLNYWHRSIQAIEERPLTGFGLGSFNREYNRLDAGRGNPGTFVVRNPHQEFLLWGVEAGIGGILVLCALMACMFRDARRGDPLCSRATLSALVALVVSCLFNSTLFDASIGDFFCVTIGLLLALGLRSAPPPAVAAPVA